MIQNLSERPKLAQSYPFAKQIFIVYFTLSANFFALFYFIINNAAH